jgi:tetratricopeptide (TPR) repeat protein
MVGLVGRIAARECMTRRSLPCERQLTFGGILAWLGEAYAAAGCRDEARKILDQLNHLSKERYVTPYGIARVYATLGQNREALRSLEIAYRDHADWTVLLKVDPCFDVLRPDPRFKDLMRRMNFPG